MGAEKLLVDQTTPKTICLVGPRVSIAAETENTICYILSLLFHSIFE
jgi:hypothetical protein